mgnify:CR=1 FL=1
MHPKFKNLPYRSNVGIMLINDDGHVFVGQRLDNNQNAWQMPQGGIDCCLLYTSPSPRDKRQSRMP